MEKVGCSSKTLEQGQRPVVDNLNQLNISVIGIMIMIVIFQDLSGLLSSGRARLQLHFAKEVAR